jgi:hypothetical protein
MMAPSPLKLLDRSNLLLRIEKHQKLLTIIKAALPAPLAAHCLDCCINDKNTLLLYCENAAWAFNLRFYAERILSGIEAQGKYIDSVQIRIAAPIPEPPRQNARRPRVNHHTAAEAVSMVAVTMPQDDLGKSLGRLAATLFSA